MFLTELPPEIREVIFQHLLPDFFHPSQWRFDAEFDPSFYLTMYESGKVIESQHLPRQWINESHYATILDHRRQASIARTLLMTCKLLRQETIHAFYSEYSIDLFWPPFLIDLGVCLSPAAKQSIRSIVVTLPRVRSSTFMPAFEAVGQFSKLEEVVVRHCDSPHSEKAYGTKWNAHVLELLQIVKQCCPHLVCTFEIPHVIGGRPSKMWSDVLFVPEDRSYLNLLSFDVDEEYAKVRMAHGKRTLVKRRT